LTKFSGEKFPFNRFVILAQQRGKNELGKEGVRRVKRIKG